MQPHAEDLGCLGIARHTHDQVSRKHSGTHSPYPRVPERPETPLSSQEYRRKLTSSHTERTAGAANDG